MNALPLKSGRTPQAVIDELVADFGFKQVFLAVAARVFRKSGPAKKDQASQRENLLKVENMDDHLRFDLGLPPSSDNKLFTDPLILLRKDFF